MDLRYLVPPFFLAKVNETIPSKLLQKMENTNLPSIHSFYLKI